MKISDPLIALKQIDMTQYRLGYIKTLPTIHKNIQYTTTETARTKCGAKMSIIKLCQNKIWLNEAKTEVGGPHWFILWLDADYNTKTHKFYNTSCSPVIPIRKSIWLKTKAIPSNESQSKNPRTEPFLLLPSQSRSWSQCYCLSPCRPMGEKNPNSILRHATPLLSPSFSLLLSQSRYDIKGNLAVSSSINILFRVMREAAPITEGKKKKNERNVYNESYADHRLPFMGFDYWRHFAKEGTKKYIPVFYGIVFPFLLSV